MIAPTIGESLEDYAERTDRSIRHAYPDWHEHGNQFAATCSAREAAEPRLDIRGRKCLGLTEAQVSAVARNGRFESRRLAAY